MLAFRHKNWHSYWDTAVTGKWTAHLCSKTWCSHSATRFAHFCFKTRHLPSSAVVVGKRTARFYAKTWDSCFTPKTWESHLAKGCARMPSHFTSKQESSVQPQVAKFKSKLGRPHPHGFEANSSDTPSASLRVYLTRKRSVHQSLLSVIMSGSFWRYSLIAIGTFRWLSHQFLTDYQKLQTQTQLRGDDLVRRSHFLMLSTQRWLQTW